jgi:uncharacterized cupin superfamily protein
MSEVRSLVVHVDDLEEITEIERPWGSHYKVLTPAMRERGGRLGVALNRVPPGHTACPFHSHLREDEVFYVLSGRGVLRYGDELVEIHEGHCVSCPAGTGVAHQLANPYDTELVYLSMGPHDPHEVCVYPDSGKVMVRALKTVGRLTRTDYMDGEPAEPAIFDLWKQRGG